MTLYALFSCVLSKWQKKLFDKIIEKHVFVFINVLALSLFKKYNLSALWTVVRLNR